MFQRKFSIHRRSNRLRKDFNTRVSFNFHVHINMCFPRPGRPHLNPHLQGPALPRSNQHGFGERRRPEEAAGGDQEGEGEGGEAGEGGEGAGEETGTARGREAAAWTEVNICPCPPLPSPSSPQPSPHGKAKRWQRSSATSIPVFKVGRVNLLVHLHTQVLHLHPMSIATLQQESAWTQGQKWTTALS